MQFFISLINMSWRPSGPKVVNLAAMSLKVVSTNECTAALGAMMCSAQAV